MFNRGLHQSQHGTQAEEDAQALRWRTAILKLSENFMEAAGERQDLSPVLMEALHNALENLLLLGDEADLLALEEWLDLENANNSTKHETVETSQDDASREPNMSISQQPERRAGDRRFTERRVNSHFKIDDGSIDSEGTAGDEAPVLSFDEAPQADPVIAGTDNMAAPDAAQTEPPAREERRQEERRACDRRNAPAP